MSRDLGQEPPSKSLKLASVYALRPQMNRHGSLFAEAIDADEFAVFAIRINNILAVEIAKYNMAVAALSEKCVKAFLLFGSEQIRAD